ncbi:histone chaperone ASF1A-like protein [Gonapodya prolifera JEL478]|uniref:Anti-silencing function protein 1 n=1 Tax=Gonapodya prolifera (strain JEL478) TaxID=1344416 RepID=A0A139AA61_GONPJ|nr:histone chaperone ASF1A-like protein [Gonapodya prolifera JEL478]|eukprot:KXS13676.1 histone chaperone ASF1A-like protein [Gonapodya prolifera JEL478]
MAAVAITNVQVHGNPSYFRDPFKFEITFECNLELKHDLEFKVIYVGSAESETLDQVLDSILVGPVPVGVNRFMFEADAPDPAKIPAGDVIGVTVILLTCSYQTREFVRVGYYVNNEYDTEELKENPPEKIIVEKVKREILAEKPRVTRFNIEWDTPLAPAQAEGATDEAMTDAAREGAAVAAVGIAT